MTLSTLYVCFYLIYENNMFTLALYPHVFTYGDCEMSIESRAKILVTELQVAQVELEKRSGVSKQVWSNAFRGKQRLNSTHIEFLCKQFPDYGYWLVTGDERFGKAPRNAEVVEHFEVTGYKFALAMSECTYMEAVIEFASTPLKEEDEQTSFSTPIPSSRQQLREAVLCEVNNEFGKAVGPVPDINQSKAAISEYFRSKAIEELQRLEEKYGVDSASYLMTSRMFTDVLMPGSDSNIHSEFNPERPESNSSQPPKQLEDNGVDQAIFGNIER